MTGSFSLLPLFAAVFAFAASFFSVFWLRRIPGGFLLDVPNERSSHSIPTPRGGGAAIAAVVLAGGALALPFARSDITAAHWPVYGAAALLIGLVSLLDDWRSLPAIARFAVHLLCAASACFWMGTVGEFYVPVAGVFSLGALGWPMTLFWIIGLTNAYNFMDGIDGIAGIQASIAGMGLAFLAAFSGHQFLCVAGVLISFSSMGFLPHNWPPAKIFMGDVGSAFLGFSFAVMPIAVSRENPRFASAVFLMAWPFVFDSAFTFMRRLMKGENVLAAHRSHLYQRLVISGMTHKSVSIFYGLMEALGVFLALGFFRGIGLCEAAVPAFIFVSAAGMWGLTLLRERSCRR